MSSPIDPSDKEDDHVLMCEFCGAEIDPDFVPVIQNKDHDDSDSSDSVSVKLYT